MSRYVLILLAAMTSASSGALAGRTISIDELNAEVQRSRGEQAAASRRMADEEAAAAARLSQQAEARAAENPRQAAAADVVGQYRDLISAKVRGNTRVPDNLTGNPEVRCLVRLLPTGEVQSVRVTQSSGNVAYDDAVVRAIEKSSPLPLPADRDARAAFVPELSFVHRPKEYPCCAYSEKPKRAFIGANVREQDFAAYVDGWAARIEQVGKAEAARRQGVYGSLRLTVSIFADGRIEAIEIDRSSGSQVLDAAAIQIVKLGEPYARFTEDMRKKVDILSITRIWTFTRSDEIVAD